MVLRRDGSSDELFEVIDGQQRLAALSILCLAIIREFGSWAGAGVDARENRQRAELFRATMLSLAPEVTTLAANALDGQRRRPSWPLSMARRA